MKASTVVTAIGRSKTATVLVRDCSLAGTVRTLGTMNKRHILISGASIAGLACAYWLRNYGFAVTIVEIAPAPRAGGQAVDLRGAGRTVVERMGMLEDARSIGLEQAGISWVDEHGRSRAAISSDDFDGEGFISEIEILRGDLVDLLNRRIGDEVEYLSSMTPLRSSPRTPTALMSSSATHRHADLTSLSVLTVCIQVHAPPRSGQRNNSSIL